MAYTTAPHPALSVLIEKNVPVPPVSAFGKPSVWPFASMVVGDSFWVPSSLDNKLKGALQSFVVRRKTSGQHFRFVTRKQRNDLGMGGTRVWRVE